MKDLILICGGTDGIGLYAANHFAEQGLDVEVCGRSPEKVRKINKTYGDKSLAGGTIHATVADVTINGNITAWLDHINFKSRNFVGLLDSAGVSFHDSFFDWSAKEWNSCFNINVTAKIELLKSLDRLGHLRDINIVIISSIWASEIASNRFSYGFAKGSLNLLIRQLALQLSNRNILVNGVAPGFINTSLLKKSFEKSNKNVTYDELVRLHPTNRLPDIVDVSRSIDFLLDKNNRSITGHIITIDAGISLASYADVF